MIDKLSTERLTLRELETRDAARMQALCGDLSVTRWLARVPHPYPEGEADRFIGLCREKNLMNWAIELNVEPGLIGVIGIDDADRHLGYWIGQSWWWRGIASEAAHRVVRFAIDELELPNLCSGAFEGNVASLRVQEKLGFRRVGTRPLYCCALDSIRTHIDTKLSCGDWASTQMTTIGGGQNAY